MKIYFKNQYKNYVDIKINGTELFIPPEANDEQFYAVINSDRADMLVSLDIGAEFRNIDETLNERIGSEQRAYKKLIFKIARKAFHDVEGNMLDCECLYTLGELTDGEKIFIGVDVIPLTKNGMLSGELNAVFPVIRSESCCSTLKEVHPKNSSEFLKSCKKLCFEDIFTSGFLTLLTYPAKMKYFRHICKPDVIKQKILNRK